MPTLTPAVRPPRALAKPSLDAVRRTLARTIATTIRTKGLTQTKAGYLMREAPSQVSLVVTGKLRGFSADRLVRMANALGHSVTVSISPATRKRGNVRTTVGTLGTI